MLAVPVQTTGAFSRGQAVKLFSAAPYYATQARNFDVSRDGQRFLMFKDLPRPAATGIAPSSINVVLNWFEELKPRVAK